MPRMAFILDRIFKRYGLHGQSTLPLVLGGAFVGGCAVPGVMATKGIADARARLATILTVPYMNCLAKVPFYTLLLGAFFKDQMATMMFYISTVTLFIALIVARMLTSTVLRTHETAPFVMELPAYHLPLCMVLPYGPSSASGSTSKRLSPLLLPSLSCSLFCSNTLALIRIKWPSFIRQRIKPRPHS